jgi:hypothetical protein
MHTNKPSKRIGCNDTFKDAFKDALEYHVFGCHGPEGANCQRAAGSLAGSILDAFLLSRMILYEFDHDHLITFSQNINLGYPE